jgi:hypothetical protein
MTEVSPVYLSSYISVLKLWNLDFGMHQHGAAA